MILSFHPLFEGDLYRICAGRDPDAEDVAAMRQASAVILPQGCRASLYRAATRSCARVFPNYDARFAYPGKIGQSRLFQHIGVDHPVTFSFADTADFFHRYPSGEGPIPPPAVVKLNWGGEAREVFPITQHRDLAHVLDRLRIYETSGQTGFILQKWIPSGARVLRVAVIGHIMSSYWRVMSSKSSPLASLSAGGLIDRTADNHLIAAAENATAAFCCKTGINLAGFDLLFSTDPSVADPGTPLFLEINYFFGRRGLRGSNAYYHRLLDAIEFWLQNGTVAPRSFGGESP